MAEPPVATTPPEDTGASAPAEAHEAAILRRRAELLARRPARETARDLAEAAIFRLGRERYAIELRWLLQIFPLRDLALLPGARPPVIGLTPWRGALLRVIDLNAALGRPGVGIADRGRVLVLADDDTARFGVLVDTIEDLRTLDLDALQPLPGRQEGDTRPLRGVTTDAVIVLDGEALLRTFA